MSRFNNESIKLLKIKLFFLLCALTLNIEFITLNCFSQNNRLWATYYGGADDEGNVGGDLSVATDTSGNVYISGSTASFAGIASGGFQNTYGGGFYDAFLVKFDAAGNRLWATYYGGIDFDYASSVATDISGNVYLAGYTNSTAGIASGGFQNTISGVSYNAFLVKFNSAGNRLWATYYGEATGNAVTTDISGNVYLTGETKATMGIASGGFQNTIAVGGLTDAFLVKFNTSGTRLWATYYGGTDYDYGYDIATDVSENIYLAGFTFSDPDIASGGFQNNYGGNGDAYLVKFNASGNRLWATYYGETGDDEGFSVATDPSDNVYLSGITGSTTGIASGVFQNIYGGGTYDGFLVKFNASGNRLWATYYGDLFDDISYSVAVNSSGSVYLGGGTNSTSGIAAGGFQNTFGGTFDAFLVKFDSAGNRFCATYYGEALSDAPMQDIALDKFNNIYFTGITQSTSGIASGGFQNTYGGGPYDAFLVKFTSCGPLTAAVTSTNINCNGLCNGSGTALASSGNSPYIYNWSTGQTTQTVTGLCEGTYTVIITDAGNTIITNTITITQSAALIASVTIIDAICNGGLGTTTVNIAGGNSPYTYLWNNTQTTQTVTGLTAGIYTVTVTDGNYCIITVSVTITEPAALTSTITVTNPICSGDSGSAVININGITAPYSYVWSNGETTSTISQLAASIYSVIITDSNGCILTKTLTIIPITPPLNVTISATTTNITSGETVQLNATLGNTYHWTPAIGLSCTNCINPIANPTASTIFCVEVTDINGCSNSACIIIAVEKLCEEIFIPTAFSPNDDEENDLECVFGSCIQSMIFIIYDRWGEKVFETTDPTKCWDGSYKNNLLKTDVFVYRLKATLLNEKEITKTGNISLVK